MKDAKGMVLCGLLLCSFTRTFLCEQMNLFILLIVSWDVIFVLLNSVLCRVCSINIYQFRQFFGTKN